MGRTEPTKAKGLGTFAGVFTPSILTILGIILFLRLGFVVGNAGLLMALGMILLANGISVLTSISLAAIATNFKVKGGGDYYLISRTLGVEFGGALGIVLFLAQSVSIAFYALGFGEALGSLFSGPPWLAQAIAAAAVAVLFVLAWLGADWATRFQYVVMTVMFAAILTFIVGALGQFDGGLLRQNLASPGELPFWVLFAIFFPAVTGFTQGVSMSGDLRDAGRSLPLGTFLAVGLSLVVYAIVAVLFAGALPNEALATDYGAMRRIAPFGWLIDAGVIAATLSSALASFLGAPRILQSLAADKVFPVLNPFAVGHGPSANPRRGVLLSLAIAAVTILVGKLNLIAPIVSMFFLISYGLLNYATYYEASSESPSFRPRFRYYHRRLSLLGAVACLGVMLAIHALAALTSVAVLFSIFHYIRKNAGPDRWADAERSVHLQRVRNNLLSLSEDPAHSRDWRPVILALSDDPERRLRLLRFAQWLEAGSGFTTVVRIVHGSGPQGRRLREQMQKEMESELSRQEIKAFARAIVVDHPDEAMPVLLQAHGLGRIFVNTLLFNWYDQTHPSEAIRRAATVELRRALHFGCNVIAYSADDLGESRIVDTPKAERRIDIWYRDNQTGTLSLLLAYLMTRTEDWTDATLRLLAPRRNGLEDSTLKLQLEKMLQDVRIDAIPVVVEAIEPEEILRHSRDASLTFLPMRLGSEFPEGTWGGPLHPLIEPLGAVAFVLASESVELESGPETGEPAEAAAILDALETARKQFAAAEALASELEGGDDAEALGTARRKLAKSAAKLKAAESDAEALS